VTELRDAPAARAGDLGEETAEMQAFEEAGDVGAPAAIGASVGPKEVDPQVAVAEALQGVFAAEDGRKEGEVGGRRGIERTRRTALAIAHGLDEAVEGAVGRGGIVDDGEGIEVTVIGRCGHGGVAREIRDALGQGVPPESPSAAMVRVLWRQRHRRGDSPGCSQGPWLKLIDGLGGTTPIPELSAAVARQPTTVSCARVGPQGP